MQICACTLHSVTERQTLLGFGLKLLTQGSPALPLSLSGTVITRDISLSRFNDLEFRLLEQNKVIVGRDGGDDRIDIPFIERKVVLARPLT